MKRDRPTPPGKETGWRHPLRFVRPRADVTVDLLG